MSTSALVGSLRVNLGLDSAQFEKGAKRSQNTLATMRKRFLVVASAAAAMGAALSAAAIKGAQDIDRAAKAARRIDSSIGGFRALELAAGEAGVSVSMLADSVQTMDREIAKGSKSAGEALKRLGLNAKSLQGLDADQKIAKIADAIQDMGLSTAQASVVLQQLGVRNREMVLAIMGGGGALRDARRDIESYGLAISKIDSDRIEKANDQIGRLGLISQYAGQQLAIALVPAMGRLAEVMTDSLREGGLLRAVIDGLVGNLDRLAVYAGVAVTAFGVKYVAALAAATLGTASLSGALIFLRTALIRTGIGAAIVAVGELVLWIDRARTATGSFGGAFQKIALQVQAGALQMKAYFLDALDGMLRAFSSFTFDVAKGLNGLFNLNLSGVSFDLTTGGMGQAPLEKAVLEAEKAARAAQRAAESLNVTLGDTVNVSDEVAKSLGEMGDSAGGGGGKKGAKEKLSELAEEVKRMNEEAAKGLTPLARYASSIERLNELKAAGLTDAAYSMELERMNEELANSIPMVGEVASAFGDFVARGFKDFKGFTQSILKSFTSMLAQMIATAARNKIMLSLGMGGSVAGTAANAAGGLGGLLGGAGSLLGGSGFLGLGGGAGSLFGGAGLLGAGGGTGLMGLGAGSGLAGALGGGALASAASIALPVIGIGIALAAAFKKTRTLIDTGLNVDVSGAGVDAQNFQTINTKRFFGLSSKTRTSNSAADPAIAQAIGDTQTAVQSLASNLGIGADAFRGFSYSFNLSLKDMNTDQAAQAVTAEISKLGDAFAAMIPSISSVNELMQVYSQRLELEDRLLELQGKGAELLARQRQRLVDATNALNRPLLQQVFALEDQAAALEEANRRIEAFAGNANNFAARADQQFAATSSGFTGSADVISLDLQRELIRAVREGDINNARITTKLLQIEERKMLEPGV